MKLLQGDDIIVKQKQCDNEGFADTCRRILQMLMQGRESEITRTEVQWLLSKLSH